MTIFISGISKGLRRDETHSFAGGVKKEGPHTAQLNDYSALMKPKMFLVPWLNLFVTPNWSLKIINWVSIS